MSLAGDRRRFCRKSRTDSAPSQPCEDVRTETSDGGMSTWSEVKKEETLELNISSHGDDLHTKPEDISIKKEDPDHEDQLYELVERCHYNESVRQQESAEIKNKLQLPSKTFLQSSPPTPCDTLCSDTSPNEIQKEIQHCSDCSKSFGHQNELQIHQCIHTGETQHHCSQCGKSFKQQSDLQQHQRIHTEEKMYCCSQCGKSFNQQSNLKGHQRTHTRGKTYDCSQCGKSFNRHYHLQRHQRIHTGEKLYHCAHCEMGFICQGDLIVHERTHTGEKPYHCSHCGKSFTQPNHVQRHQRIHTGDKPYHCS
ncbi:uncharacterized protein Hap1MRO34_014857 [Clarias gariepinus]